ncbi:MAG TPA: hypothetical protein ENI80_03780 [Acidiferrobacteraceae bacterium]|nr:hypothetical protein [Acidiferrobacteraceae bacterium]
MDFKLVLGKLVNGFEKNGVDYALIGGLALGLLGVPRATTDIDILVHREDLDKIDKTMHNLGYKKRFSSENVSQYTSAVRSMGDVDFLHAFREASIKMLERAQQQGVFGGTLQVKLVRAEDLIGLKIQAIKNNPSRTHQDLADIEALIARQDQTLDWQELQAYFELFDMKELFDSLRSKDS